MAKQKEGDEPAGDAVTVIIVSYNTRELTLKAVETLLANAGPITMRVIVFDNASADGSADAVRNRFPTVEVVANSENIGFAAANNAAALMAETPWLLLLNPDTETHPNAIANLVAFAESNPGAGIVGGRTVFPDGSLNPASCWGRPTVWSLFAAAVGLSQAFPRSKFFHPEALGDWQRDSDREVDVVVGCFLLIPTDLWHRLGGFDARYFMYGEDADLCLRARALGYRPMITHRAQIMHLVGASTKRHADKVCAVMRARATLVRDHWPAGLVPVGLSLMWLWAAVRGALSLLPIGRARQERLRQFWVQRKTWLAGFPREVAR